MKDLHNFQFDEAAEAFKRAQKADPNFVMAFWGEAMSYNHPLWAQQDTDAAKRTIEKIAPTLDGASPRPVRRRRRRTSPPSNALLRAGRQAGARHRLLRGDGQDVCAVAGGSRSGDAVRAVAARHRFVRATRASAVRRWPRRSREKIYRENPKHPGAAHFIIHSFDDPDHAPLALPAARAYAGIAPSAAHALHMPSHIFVQLGMWEDAAKSNIVAYKAAADLNTRMKLAEGREDFHTLGWLGYANLMMGKFDEAKKNLELAKAASDRNPTNTGVRNGYLGMRARVILETGQWEKIALEAPPAPGAANEHANMPGMAMPQYGGNNTWTFIAGYSAAKMGDYATADAAEAQLKSAREKLEATNPYGAKPIAIMEKQVGAVSRFARGQKDEALKLAKEAMEIELTLAAPSGPPDPIKPAPELYGELLLEAGRTAEARAALELSLQRTPNRTPSVKAMQRATATTSTQAR